MSSQGSAPRPAVPHVPMTQVLLGVLRKGPTWSPEETEETHANQERHLALLFRLRDEGVLLMSGPIPEGEDYRGFVVLDLDSEGDGRALFEADAHLQSGRLQLDLYPWLVPTEILQRLRA